MSWNASSDSESGLSEYKLYIDGSLNRDNISSSSASTTPVSALSNGNHTWYIVAVDAAGNTTQSTSTWTIRIDTLPPTTPGTPSTTSPTNSTSQTWSGSAATDAVSGVADYAWRVADNVGTAITNGTTTATSVVTNLTQGIYSFFVKANDNAGNAGSEASGGVTVDTTAPNSFDLDSPSDNSYTNSERPNFRWKAASTGDATSGLSKYKLEVNNGDSGSFTVDSIPTSGTTDVQNDKYIIHFDGFNDSDNTNNYISVYTKSSSAWGSDNNDGKLKEGKRNWKVTAYDNAGNTREESRTLFVDRSSPNVEITQLNSLKITNKNTTLKTNTTPTIYGKITDSLVGDKTENKISSGPKSIEVKIEKQNTFGLFYDLHSMSTVNLNVTYLTGGGDKYSGFEFTPSKKLSLGNYKITFTGKDNAGNTGGSTTINLNVTTQNQITTSQTTTGVNKKIIDKPAQIININPTPTPKTETPIQKPKSAKNNFCILWWCF